MTTAGYSAGIVEKREDEKIAKGIVKFLVDVHDEERETSGDIGIE